MSDITKLGEVLIEESQKLEPCQTEVCIDEVEETKIVYEQADFGVAASSQSTVFGLRTILGNRLGFITTNSLDPIELKNKAAEAQMIARLSPPSPFHSISDKGGVAGFFEMADPKIRDVKPKEILQRLEYFVGEACSDKHVTLDRAEMNVTSSTRMVLNSNGVSQKMRHPH